MNPKQFWLCHSVPGNEENDEGNAQPDDLTGGSINELVGEKTEQIETDPGKEAKTNCDQKVKEEAAFYPIADFLI
ncbi:MAG: hypothetical protein AAF206_01920 [Bacteroidota bacterium]